MSRTGSFPFLSRSAGSRATIGANSWAQREREADYRAFFDGEVARLGATPAAIHYLPQLMPGDRGERNSRAHAHGLCDADRQRRGDQRRARLLGRDLSAARAPREEPSPRPTIRPRFSPSSMGRRRSGMSNRSAIFYGTSCARSPRSRNSRPSSTCWRSDPRRMTAPRGVSLALYAATLDFCALHAVTGTHWLR